MTEWTPVRLSITIKPMTDEDAERITKVIEKSEELGKRILARRKGKPLPPSWRLIRQEREKRSKRI